MSTVDELRHAMDNSQSSTNDAEKSVNAMLKGRDVILKWGKYKGRRAQIQSYSYQNGSEWLHVWIYRKDGRVGFKGREKFIDDHYHEYYRYEDCELQP